MSSPALARFFEKFIASEDDRLLLRLLIQKYGRAKVWFCPVLFLPTLLQKSVSNAELASIVVPVLGERGKWVSKPTS